MRFALVNDVRVEATPKKKGICPGCDQSVTAKCGKKRIWHWAHDTKKNCDRWWETETEWHRSWKNKFPKDWQEFIQHDHKGEKHIADVRTAHGLVIEFQHSHLKPEERILRESFYGNMVWVVNGTRLKRDYPRFLKGIEDGYFSPTPIKGHYLTTLPHVCFPKDWLESTVPVIFDFHETCHSDHAPDMTRESLWCLLPGRAEGKAVVIRGERNSFVEAVSNRKKLFDSLKTINTFAQYIREQQVRAERELHQQLIRQSQRSRFRRRRYARF